MTNRLRVLVQAWPRYLERAEYAERTLAAFRSLVNLDEWPGPIDYVVSAETAQCHPDAVLQLARSCRDYDFRLRWHTGAPSVGTHLNDALAEGDWDWVLYLQEDHEAVRDVPVTEAQQMLWYHNPPEAIARFTLAKPPTHRLLVYDDRRWHVLTSNATDYLFAHNPYLAPRAFFNWMGPFAETHSEDVANEKAKRLHLPIILHQPNCFKHIGDVPAMTEKHAARRKARRQP